MITRPTVFVLGAGASHPYKFPLGQELLKEVVDGLRETTFRQEVCEATDVDIGVAKSFANSLAVCGRSSIDAFLETRHEFLEVGKAAIARVLSAYEVDEHLTTNPPREGWYRYLFDKMLTPKPEEFALNRLTVVTFNFDRSFERALVLSLQANYGLSENDAIPIAKGIPVYHVHGQLGPLWATDDQVARPYARLTTDANARRIEIQKCSKQIRIVHEEVEHPMLRKGREKLAEAEVVCFLGFGYHATNLERLRVKKLGTPNKVVHGTRHLMNEGEWLKAKQAFPNIYDHKMDVLSFLQTTSVIHG